MLEVRSQYLYPEYLGSERVDAPDPLRTCYLGQQLVIRFKVPRRYFHDATLMLDMRYGDFSTQTYRKCLKIPRGYWVIRLVNQDYWCRCGILSYKVELLSGEEVIATKCHHLWADLILD
jgi:hypothetical protein